MKEENMTEFVELTAEEYGKFYASSDQRTFLNSPEAMEHLRMRNRDIIYFGVKKNGTLAGACALSSFAIAKKMFRCYYAQRGFMLDYSDEEVLHCMCENVKKYAKKHRGLFLIIDPYINYYELDIEGKRVEGGYDNSYVAENLKKEGFIHREFTFDNSQRSQAAFMFVMDLTDRTEAQVLKEISQQTRWCINRTIKQGVEVRELSIDELDIFIRMEEKTAKRRNFDMYSDSYYKQMYEAYGDHMKVLLASLSPLHLLEALSKEAEALEKEKAEIEEKLQETPGSRKFLKKQKVNEEAFEINAKKQAEARELQEKYGDEIHLASSIFTVYDNECVYYASAAEEEFRNYFGPYAIQWYMIRWCIEHHVNRYNFYGISGDFREDADDYGVYEFKKGFGGTVEQMIGDFILVLNKPVYALYEKLK